MAKFLVDLGPHGEPLQRSEYVNNIFSDMYSRTEKGASVPQGTALIKYIFSIKNINYYL